MNIRKNRSIEREAVNATRTFFEANGCVFQEVDLVNDYGKDAYVDFGEGEKVTGICFALQIKGGISYRRGSNYGIPLDAAHVKVWGHSSIPIVGIVYDPTDTRLRWCNISNFIDEMDVNIPPYIPINSSSVLNSTTLRFDLITSLERSSKWHIEHPLLNLFSKSEDIQLSALYDCFAHGRSDARVLIALRYMLKALDKKILPNAIRILSHVTPHPDIFWGPENWIPTDVKEKVLSHFKWDIQEIINLLSAITWEDWDRGNYGEDLYLILYADPGIRFKMKQVAIESLDQGNEDAAFAALYLYIYWSGQNGMRQFKEIIAECPGLIGLPLSGEIEQQLQEFGYIALF